MADIGDSAVDLLIVDYGGLGYGQAMDDETRMLLRWADEHPGTLVLVWSSVAADEIAHELTQDRYDDESGERVLPTWPGNVRSWHMGVAFGLWPRTGDSIDWLIDSGKVVRQWFPRGPR
jgi:hypothetical protein